jgi:hypothetical protein
MQPKQNDSLSPAQAKPVSKPSAKAGPKAKAKVKAEVPRSNRARQLSDLLPDVGGQAFKRFGFVQSALIHRWPEIVGASYARASRPETLRFPMGAKENGVLCLKVHGAHGAMLAHILPDIMERVNRFFGYSAVAKITLRHTAAYDFMDEPSVTIKQEKTPLNPEVGESLKAITDPELRAVLESLAQGVADKPIHSIGLKLT